MKIKENASLYDSESRKIKAEVDERVVQLEILEKDADLFVKVSIFYIYFKSHRMFVNFDDAVLKHR